MDHEPEVIRKEMAETRSALSEKLEALGQQVVGTVQDAREAVRETVDTVKGAVTDTVSTVKDQVTGTVSDVKHSVGSTVDTMKETFNVEHQVVNHPWVMVGGAVALGYVGGILLHRMSAPPRPAYPDFPPPRPSTPVARTEEWDSTRTAGQGAASTAARFTAPPVPAAAPQEHGLPTFLKGFEPELQQLKGVAIGALFGVIRDLVQRSLPPNLTEPVTEVVNNLTTKMGGQPIQGHLLDTGHNGR